MAGTFSLSEPTIDPPFFRIIKYQGEGGGVGLCHGDVMNGLPTSQAFKNMENESSQQHHT